MKNKSAAEKLKFVHLDCPTCGAELVYNPEKEKLACVHCGYDQPIAKENHLIVEKVLKEATRLQDDSELWNNKVTYHCNNCGAITKLEKGQVEIVCTFCGSNSIDESAYEKRVIQPIGLIPFKIPQKQALQTFKNWIKKGFFTPGKLKKIARLQQLKGIYLPFWTFDVNTQSDWIAKAGYYYYETESYTGSDGKRKTRRERKTRWEKAQGRFEHFFDDILINASSGLPQRTAETIFPFMLENLINFDSSYLLGFEAEVYQKDIHEGYEVADQIMTQYIRRQCIKQIPGDTYRSLKIQTQKSQHRFKHILLPIWISSYRYKNKIYRFIVNGQTGKASGQKPVSWSKIIALLLTGSIIGLALYYLLSAR